MTIAELYELFRKSSSISTDTRNIKPNSIFFALKGANFNGNQFANDAIEAGAAFAVIDEAAYKTNKRYILVEDTLTTLQNLATFHRQQLDIPILAITGTNGKTTTKELTAAVLSQKYETEFTRGNLNNHIGVPLTLLSMTEETEIGIVEMGANHPGEIAFLCDIALPNYGLITNVGKAHLEGFGSFEGVKVTKSELYRYLQKSGGRIFINQSNPDLMEMAGPGDFISYSSNKDGIGLKGKTEQSSPFLVFKVKFPKGWLYIKTKLIGNYNLENALAACCIGQYFDIDPLKIQTALTNYTPENNRSQLIQTERNQLLMDAYNANPTSMMAALTNFTTVKASHKTVILGDMLELGENSADEHQKIIDELIKLKADRTILVGQEFKHCHLPNNFEQYNTTELAIFSLKENPLHDSFVLIKGSRGIKLEKMVPWL